MIFLLIIFIFSYYYLLYGKSALTVKQKESADPCHIHLRLCTASIHYGEVHAYAYTSTCIGSSHSFEVQIRDEIEHLICRVSCETRCKDTEKLIELKPFSEKTYENIA